MKNSVRSEAQRLRWKNRNNIPKGCSVEGCERKHAAKGFCAVHYAKNYTQIHGVSKKYPQYLDKYRTTDKYRFKTLKEGAKVRGISVELTLDQFVALREAGACHYCGGALPERSHGIDRIDNKLPYVVGNLVPCCSECNYTKGSRLSYEEMCLIAQHRAINVGQLIGEC